jgi:F420-0:gamma-glutamyl ligase-like protein
VTDTDYANKLEQWYNSTPEIVQSVLAQPFNAMNGTLKAVAGNPQELMAAGARCTERSTAVRQIALLHGEEAKAVTSVWSGEAFSTFDELNEEFTDKVDHAAELIAKIEEVLKAAAEAAIEGADMIFEIIVELVEMAIATLVLNAALAAVTFGTSMLAAAAEVVGESAVALSRVAAAAKKVAGLLIRVEKVLQKLSKILLDVAEYMKRLEKTLQTYKEVKEALEPISLAWDSAKMAKGVADSATDMRESVEEAQTTAER